MLTSTPPTAISPVKVPIGHPQLRDLIVCPRERGVVNYVQSRSIAEHNLNSPETPPRTLAKLSFIPNTLTSLAIDGSNDTLLAAGGQGAEVHLSHHAPSSGSSSRLLWQHEYSMGGSINNSVLLTSLALTRSNQSSIEPRIGISNNDCTVKFYDVPLRAQNKRVLDQVGGLTLDVPVNHSSISPDGQTLLSVGDSSKVYLHQITGGAALSFTPIKTLTLPPADLPPSMFATYSVAASFSTAFSSNGSKYAVASQEGVLVVWDVRSTKPLKVFQTDKTRLPASGNGGATGWLSDEFGDWTRGGDGWSVRNVKFGGSAKEVMTFTEHTSLLHVVDARTFETEEIVQVPTVRGRTPAPAVSESLPSPPLSPHPSHRISSPLSNFAGRHVMSPSPSPPPPRRHGHVSTPRRASQLVQALGDTFRVSSPYAYSPPSSISDSTWRALRMSGPSGDMPEREDERYDYGDVLVIPPLGDRGVEADVQALLGSHGIRARAHTYTPTRRARVRQRQQHVQEEGEDGDGEDDRDTNTGSTHADYEYLPVPSPRHRPSLGTVRASRREEEAMDVDEQEEERDCVPSHMPSRSSSPSPSTHVPTYGRGSPAGGRVGSPAGSVGRSRSVAPPQVTYDDDLDLAGTCFDPSGRFLYVASTEGVVEWSVRGAEKKWWFESGWV